MALIIYADNDELATPAVKEAIERYRRYSSYSGTSMHNPTLADTVDELAEHVVVTERYAPVIRALYANGVDRLEGVVKHHREVEVEVLKVGEEAQPTEVGSRKRRTLPNGESLPTVRLPQEGRDAEPFPYDEADLAAGLVSELKGRGFVTIGDLRGLSLDELKMFPAMGVRTAEAVMLKIQGILAA